MFCKVYYTNCDEFEIKFLIDCMPLSHAFGDELSVLENGTLQGLEQHDAYCSRSLRKKTRIRTFVFQTLVTHVGGYGPYQRRAIREHHALVALVSVPDWSGKDLDIDEQVLVQEKPLDWPVPVGSKYFHGPNYSRMVYLDFCLAFEALQKSCGTYKLWLKIAPLAMGPTITTAEKINIFPFAAPWYTQGLAMAIQKHANAQWVHAIELIDFTGTLSGLANFLVPPPNVQIIVPSNRDILDFTACPIDILPACIAPVDAFSAPWRKQPSTTFDNIASCIVNNTNIIFAQDKSMHYEKCT